MELKNLGQTAASALIHTDIRLEREHWTMFRNKLLGIAAAATLGTAAMLGSTVANAQINLDATATGKASPSVTYATETLTAKVSGSSTHYVVTDDTNLDITATLGPAGGGAEANNMKFTYTLQGAVFNTPLTNASLSGATGVSNPVLASGGTRGDSMAVFTAVKGDATSTTVATLNIADLGVMPNSSASVSLEIVNRELEDLAGTDGTKTASYPDAVAVMSGVMPDAEAETLTARVTSSYQDFGKTEADPPAAILTGTLGSLTVGMTSPTPKNAAGGADVTGIGVLVGAAVTDVNSVGTDSTVTIMGDFSFVSRAWLDSAATCDGTAGTELRIMDDPDDTTKVTDTTKLRAQALGYVNANPNLCITVTESTTRNPVSIPRTTYTAMVTYKAGTAGGMMLPADQSHPVGEIARDGTTIRVPFLTTYEGYNQRLVLVNRGKAVDYSINFMPEAGTMATPMSAATGMLPANSTSMMLSRDIVTLSGDSSRTAAEITVEAVSGTVDAATVTVNNMDGSTDTVLHMPTN